MRHLDRGRGALLGVLAGAVVLLAGLPLFAAGARETTSTQSVMTYSVFPRDPLAEKYINNPNDVVTPWIENKFNIKVGEVTIYSPSIPPRQRFDTMAAANAVPDVIIDGKDNLNYFIASGLYADLTDQIKTMKNMLKYFDPAMQPYYLYEGKQYEIPSIEVNLNDPKYRSDPYNLGLPNWTLWVREDILAKAGYRFTPVDDLQKAGVKPTPEQYAITPAIDTPEKFADLLRKIKALNLKVGDRTVVPLSVTSWQQWHLGSMFAFGPWHKYADGSVGGFLGSPGAKDWYRFLAMLNREGLIDPDWLIQKEEQLQEKASSGLVAVGMYLNDIPAARANMAKVDPSFKIRYMAWPKQPGAGGYFDVNMGGFERAIIAKSVKDIPRLVQYFDWFYSDEGLQTITWGPAEAGLWELRDGKRVFKDKQVENDMLNVVRGGRGADYYGLFDHTSYTLPFLSKAAIAAPKLMVGNPFSYVRSYPSSVDVFRYGAALYGSAGMDYTGKSAASIPGDGNQAVLAYYWGKFVGDRVGRLLQTTTDAQFNTVWDEQFKLFSDEGQYPLALQEAVKWFNDNGVK